MNDSSRRLLVLDTGFTCDIDGPGQRMVIYLKGCNLCCPWCATPESLSPFTEVLFYSNRISKPQQAIRACPHGAVVFENGQLLRKRSICDPCRNRECLRTGLTAFERVGHEMEIGKLVELAERYKPFFGETGGVTIGGGEPTCQLENVHELLCSLKQQGIHTAMETNGTSPALVDLFSVIDLLMIDFKHPNDETCRALTGHGNAEALNNMRERHGRELPMRVRLTLVPGYNMEEAILERFGEILGAIGRLTVELLAFHKRGEVKWNALSRVMPARDRPVPSVELMARARALLLRHGLNVV